MRKKNKQPTFSPKSELARYVDPDEIKSGGRVSSGAFMPSPVDTYLSVNSLELEKVQEIARYYRQTRQGGTGNVAVACCKVVDYNNAANFAGLSVQKNSVSGRWEFNGAIGVLEAYKYRWTHLSNSHCGVEFINAQLDELRIKKIARRLAGQRPHLFELK